MNNQLMSLDAYNFISTSQTSNLKFILGKFLSQVLYIHNDSLSANNYSKDFSTTCINKYFNCIRQLLIDKFIALNGRIYSMTNYNRHTKIYIKSFQHKRSVFIGFYFSRNKKIKNRANSQLVSRSQ